MKILCRNNILSISSLAVAFSLISSIEAQQSSPSSSPTQLTSSNASPSSSSLPSSSSAASSTDLPPTCSLLCLETLIPKSPCAISNITCVCTNAVLVTAITECVTANCTIREQLLFDKYSHQTCGVPGLDNTKLCSIIGLTGGSFALVAFGLRIVAKLRGAGGPVGWDDLFMSLAALANVPFTTLSAVLANLGLGLDMWEVSFDGITQILHVYYWSEILYLTALPFTRIAILLFYLRIFPNRKFRRVVYTLIGMNIIGWIIFLLLVTLQCKPISGAWTRWDGTFTGKCLNVNLLGWAGAIFTITQDIISLFLPLPVVAGLALSLRKKLHISFMFSVGISMTVVSCIRLRALVNFANTTNVTQDYVVLGYWSTIEAHLGIICACLPAIRQLFRHTFPTILGSTSLDSEPVTSDNARGSERLSLPSPKSRQMWQDEIHDHTSDCELVDLEDRVKYGVAA